MGKISEAFFSWLRKYKFLILGLAVVFLVVFSFTHPGRCIIAGYTITYYDFTLSQDDFIGIEFDASSCPKLGEEDARRAKGCILRLGRLDISSGIIVELVEIGPGAVPMLVEALRKGNAPTRCQAALALGLIREPSAFGPLVGTLVDGEERVRMAGALALGNLGDERAKPYLIKCLKVHDKWARFAAAKALIHMRSLPAVLVLRELEGDPDVGAEAAELVADYWKGSFSKHALIDSGRPVPSCILKFRED